MLTVKGFWNGNIACVVLSFAVAIALGLGCDRKQPITPSIKSQAAPTPPTETVLQYRELVTANTSIGLPLKLRIRIDGFANDKGVCRVAVYLGKAHFNDPEFAIVKESIAVLDSKAEVLLGLDIPENDSTTRKLVNPNAENNSTKRELVTANTPPKLSIAVSAYHDENDNSRLDKNSFGIPIERYGFSMNPQRGFGPPKFSEAAIQLDVPKMQNELGTQLSIPMTIK